MADRRESLLLAAAELFAHRGYRATTLDDVAEALNMKKATVYHYIDSKEELLSGIYARIFDRIEARVRPIAEQKLRADERLRRMVAAHLEVVAEESAMLAVVFREEAELEEKNRREFQRRKREYERIFEKVVEEGQGAGILRPFTPQLLVRALLGMCNWLYQWYRPERHSAATIGSEFLLLLESGWLADEGAKKGAWSRPDTVADALDPVREATRRAQTALEDLQNQLARAEARLEDGLAGPR